MAERKMTEKEYEELFARLQRLNDSEMRAMFCMLYGYLNESDEFLRGVTNLMNKYHPAIEVIAPATNEKVKDELKQLGYVDIELKRWKLI